MKRKITSFILLLAMLVSIVAVLPVASFAADTTFKGTDVTLTDGILLNFYVEADDALGIDNAEKDGDYYVLTVGVPAKKMGDDVVAEFKAGVDVVCEYSYSVKQYANGILTGNYDAETKALVRAMLNYGAAAQKFFDYNADDLAGTPVADTTALKAAVAPEIEVVDEAGSFIGASLLLEGTMTLRFYFAGTVDSATVDGEAAVVNGDSAKYCYVDVKVAPDNIDKAYEVAAGDTTVKYSVLNYLQRNADEAELSEMVASIYAYGVAADSYVNSRNKTPLENLQDEGLLVYEYPIEEAEFMTGTVAYNTYESFANHFVYNQGKAKTMIIDITDTTFDSVRMQLPDNYDHGGAGYDPYVTFAFLTEKPELDQPVKYAEGYCTYKAAWINDFATDIPKDARYLVIWEHVGGLSYIPRNITFVKGENTLDNIQNEELDSYEYPTENIIFDHGVINYYNKEDIWDKDGDIKVSLINITDCAFDYLTLTRYEGFKSLGWTFLQEIPEWQKSVKYAGDYTEFKWNSSSYESKNIEIPDDANYLVLWYQEGPKASESYYFPHQGVETRYYPKSIIFHNTKK